jgi:membrane-associated protease RseP (regulator of RpoE activity)
MDFAWHLASFIGAISVLVTVHEYGHFWVASRFGVKVLRFSVGFGKPLSIDNRLACVPPSCLLAHCSISFLPCSLIG